MKLYRICTENKNYNDVLDYLDEHFPDGYTVLHANGAWQGVREKSLVIEIMGKDIVDVDNTPQNSDVGKLAYWLKKHNDQQAILVQVLDVVRYLL